MNGHCITSQTPRKKHKATVKYQGGKLTFAPARKNVAVDLAAAAQSTKSRLVAFYRGLEKQYLSYKEFPLKDTEIEVAIKEVMKNRRVVASSAEGGGKIVILATDKKLANEAVNAFRTCCMPEKNECVGVLEVLKQTFRVTVVHGDFRSVKADVLLSQLNEDMMGRVLLHYTDPLTRSWTSDYLRQDNSIGTIGSALDKPNLEYKW